MLWPNIGFRIQDFSHAIVPVMGTISQVVDIFQNGRYRLLLYR